MSRVTINPFEFMVDASGKALDAGYIYIGVANLDPITNPITVYYDEAMTIPAAQPIRTVNGFVLRSGAPTRLHAASNYSVTVQNKNHVQVYTIPDIFAESAEGSSVGIYVNTLAELRLITGSNFSLYASTGGYYAAGDGGDNEFYWDAASSAADNTGSIIKPTAVSGAGRWIQKNKSTINIRDFGVNPSQNGTTNRTCFNNATAAAVLADYALYVPSGVYDILANNGTTSGCTIRTGANKSLFIYGDGKNSVIRREATATLTDSSSIIRLSIASNNSYHISKVMFDGNESNCPIDEGQTFTADGVAVNFPYVSTARLTTAVITGGVESIQVQVIQSGVSPNWTSTFIRPPAAGSIVKLFSSYMYEHCANVAMTGTQNATSTVTFDNVYMTGIIGDGLFLNVQFARLQIDNWISYGRTRRPRADIQFSRIPTISANLNNVTCDALEFEPSGTTADNVVNFNNIFCLGAFDLGGDTNFANVNATNVKVQGKYGVGLPFTNFYKIKGRFSNCSFYRVRRIQRSDIEFSHCAFQVAEHKTTVTLPDAIEIWHDITASRAEFSHCTFDCDAIVTSGFYIQPVVVTSDASRLLSFCECRNYTKLDNFVSANRHGTLTVDGGELSANSGVCLLSNGGAPYVSNLNISNPSKWSGGGIMTLGAIAGPTKITLNGVYDADAIPLITNSAATNANITFLGSLIGTTATNPNGVLKGVPGTIIRVNNAVAGTVVEYRYKPTALNRYGELTYTSTATL